MKQSFFLLLLVVCLSACNNYGKKVKSGNAEVYYKEGVTEAEAKKTADLFYQSMKQSGADTKDRKSFQLSKPGDTVLLKMAFDKEKANAVTDDVFYAISDIVSENVFDGKPVNLILTDNKFKEVRTLVFIRSDKREWGEKITAGNIEVYRKDLEEEKANELASFLDRYLHPETSISFQADKNSNDVLVIKMVSNPGKAGDITAQQLTEICKEISNRVFNGAPLIFQMTDVSFKPIRTFEYPADATAPPDNE